MKAFLIGLICFGLVAGAAEAATITTFSIKGARGVYPSGINKNGEITGTYLVGSGTYGFIRNPNGEITKFHASNVGASQAIAIDAVGNVAGHSRTCPRSHPCFYATFVRALDGSITHFSETKGENDDIQPCCIRSDGWIAGYGFTHKPRRDLWYSFIRSPSGVITPIASLPNCGFSAMATSMNLSHTITGNCSEANQALLSGFIRTPDGNTTVFGMDGASVAPTGIKDDGVVVGYVASAGGDHGFIRQTNGTINTFDVPNSTGTFPMAVNSKGAIAGYWASGSTAHGFVRSPNGKITTIDVSGATSTWVAGINNKGIIIGNYLDQSNIEAAFVRTP